MCLRAEERVATEKLRLWEERSTTEDLSVLCKRGIQTRDGRADLTCKKSQRLTVCEPEKEQSRGKARHPGLGSQHVAGASLSLWMAPYKHACPFK